MANFDTKADYEYMMQRLRLSCIGVPFEIQLIWAFEILMIKLYLALSNSPLKNKLIGRLKGNPDTETLNTHYVTHAYKYFDVNPEICSRLAEFRHLFVHKGYLEAQPYLDGILNCDAGLASLSTVTGVDFTITNTLI